MTKNLHIKLIVVGCLMVGAYAYAGDNKDSSNAAGALASQATIGQPTTVTLAQVPAVAPAPNFVVVGVRVPRRGCLRRPGEERRVTLPVRFFDGPGHNN